MDDTVAVAAISIGYCVAAWFAGTALACWCESRFFLRTEFVMRKLLIPAVAIAGMFLASTAEAGPIRNLLGRLKGKPRAVAKKVVKAPAAVVRGGCANGSCSK
jgi:hypothetical protein